jgi:polysaccharide chain length determinant protein (PEP-CTERM system associated)
VNQEYQISLAPYFDIIYRHRVSSVCALVAGLGITLSAVIMLPNVYRSTTLVMIQPQEVPSEYVSVPITSHIRDRLQALSQIALSRTRLEEIITRYQLYGSRRARGEPMDGIVQYMRRHIHIDIAEDRNDQRDSRGASFSLSYEYFDPQTAQRVTAQLADLFIDEDLKQRAQQAAATTAFLDEQLAKSRAALEAKGRDIKVFKDRYQGSLPQDLEVNLKILGDLQSQLQSDNEALAGLQERRLQLDRDLARAREDKVTVFSLSGEKGSASPEAALTLRETVLAELQAEYSERYPDVVRLKAEIASLKALIKRRKDGKESMSPVEAALSKEIDNMEVQERRLQTEIPNLKKEISEHQTRIAETPAHEQQFANLTRDYNVLDTDYHRLLNKKLEAQMSQNLEQRQEGERFQVLDPANLPKDPESPDRKAIAVLGVVLSLILAGALPFALFFTDTSFKDPDELRREFDLSVAAIIPQLDEIEDLGQQLRVVYQAVAISSACFVLGLGAVWLYATTIF